MLSFGLLIIGLWAAVRRWHAAEGLLTAAVALSAIAYAVLTRGYWMPAGSKWRHSGRRASNNERRPSKPMRWRRIPCERRPVADSQRWLQR